MEQFTAQAAADLEAAVAAIVGYKADFTTDDSAALTLAIDQRCMPDRSAEWVPNQYFLSLSGDVRNYVEEFRDAKHCFRVTVCQMVVAKHKA